MGDATEERQLRLRRLVVNLPMRVYRDLAGIAADGEWTLTAVVKQALRLRGIVEDEGRKGNRLAVVDREGKVVRELELL